MDHIRNIECLTGPIPKDMQAVKKKIRSRQRREGGRRVDRANTFAPG
jgi:hypothetical protein